MSIFETAPDYVQNYQSPAVFKIILMQEYYDQSLFPPLTLINYLIGFLITFLLSNFGYYLISILNWCAVRMDIGIYHGSKTVLIIDNTPTFLELHYQIMNSIITNLGSDMIIYGILMYAFSKSN